MGEAALVRAQPAPAAALADQPPRGARRLLHPLPGRGRGAGGARRGPADGSATGPCSSRAAGSRWRPRRGSRSARAASSTATRCSPPSERIEIGDHVMFANGCFVGDADHRFDDPEQPITWQGFTSQGPGADRLQLLVRGQLRRHQRGDDRRALRDRRQLGRHRGPAAADDRRRRPGEGDPRDRVPPAREGSGGECARMLAASRGVSGSPLAGCGGGDGSSVSSGPKPLDYGHEPERSRRRPRRRRDHVPVAPSTSSILVPGIRKP